MAEGEEMMVAAARSSRSARRIATYGALALLGLLLVGFLIVWFSRERIADNIIADQLEQYDLSGTYEIESIGPARQVVRNVVIGDPDDPDLTVDRVVVNLRYRLGFPAIGRVEIYGPRLYGEVTEEGSITFGELDKVIFAESDEPPGLPDLDLLLDDGRARIDTPWGDIGIKARGEGELDDGFAGTIAAIAPEFAYGGCALERLTLYGNVEVDSGKPDFEGPLRLGGAECPGSGVSLAKSDFTLKVTGDATLDGVDTELGGKAGKLAFSGGTIDATTLTGKAAIRDSRLVASFDTNLNNVNTSSLGLASLDIAGAVRSDAGFASLQSDVAIEGEGVRLDRSLFETLRGAEQSAEGSLLAPLLAQLTTAVERQVVGGSLAADATLRATDNGYTVVVPRASLRSAGGATLASLSRAQVQFAGAGLPLVSGNVAVGGGGLPQIQGRMERDSGGNTVFRIRMAPYEAQGSRLAFSDLEVRQSRSGALTLNGAMQADGPLPGGEVRGLKIPLKGQVAANGTFSMWAGCTPITFDRLTYAQLTLDAERLTLCPQRGAPILRYGAGGLQVAAGTGGLDLKGTIASSPITLSSGAVGMAWPGALAAKDVNVVIGNDGSAARMIIPELTGVLGDRLSGTFASADMGIDPVPLDIFNASGTWAYEDGVLSIGEAAFRIEDRNETNAPKPLFEPLFARDGTLVLADNVIAAEAALREPSTDRVITDVDVVHNLVTGAGRADLAVTGVTFDDRLQPVTLTDLARGLVALAEGTVRGNGEIVWTNDTVTSEGRFTTDSLDFAAPFGPVQGASGTIVFDDLLALNTAPDQQLFVESINPGIEARDGRIIYELVDGTLLDVKRASWPFLGGTLDMRPIQLDFSAPEARQYYFDVRGLEAALFIEQLEIGNLAATGTFDGVLSILFDEEGNGYIQDSTLIARPPGGNLSYVGELTYEDMGAIANFAFRSLKSLDFEQMRVGVEGPLAGEVLTAISFEGVTQGEGADRNFITRRLGNLPIRFNVNIRAPFYQLLTSMRSLYDPEYVADPRALGLLKDEEDDDPVAPELARPQPSIQDPESENEP